MVQLYQFKSYQNVDNSNLNDSSALSILDLIGMEQSQVEPKMFKLINNENKFFQIKITALNEED